MEHIRSFIFPNNLALKKKKGLVQKGNLHSLLPLTSSLYHLMGIYRRSQRLEQKGYYTIPFDFGNQVKWVQKNTKSKLQRTEDSSIMEVFPKELHLLGSTNGLRRG
ncbi:hypothetical protein ACH5RR_018416 [Cinchona calisaya]|uniref:Uncharacterized protein n=1 Tax=Cinchona calisaya TaxID=153742 RepID=A0ABD2ZP80_9GENT